MMTELTLYTDGSCLQNPGPGGWAFAVIQNNQSTHEQFGNLGQTTNNQMELQAVIEALKWILKIHGPQTAARVITDSRYVQQGVTAWIHNWKRNNWRSSQGEPVKNQDYWRALDALNAQLKIDWQWVKAHHVDPWNHKVDALAREGAVSQRSSHV